MHGGGVCKSARGQIIASGQSCFLLGAVGNHHSASTYLPSSVYHCAYDLEEDLIVPASVKAANGDELGAVAHQSSTEADLTIGDLDFADTPIVAESKFSQVN